MGITAALVFARGAVAAISYASPLQLHPCADGALSQQWTYGGNGSIYSLDHSGTLGYCLDISGNQHPPQHGAKAGQQVFASNCGQSRADPTAGSNQLWAVRGDTIASLQPATPFCFGVPPNKSGVWDGRASQSGQLSDCTSPAAQFRFGAATTAVVTTATAADATPTVCKVASVNVACYVTKGGGPCSPCPGPLALPTPAAAPANAKMSWELCAQLCYGLNLTKAGVEYGQQCSCGDAVNTTHGNHATAAGCTMECAGGGSKETCGGNYHISIFDVVCTGPRVPPVVPPPPPPPTPPPPPPPPIPPPPPCPSYASKAACPALRCDWSGGGCVAPPPQPTGTITHRPSGLCLTVGRCAVPPAPTPNLPLPTPSAGARPCDIYELGGHPCVAAHSMVRALFGAFDGALYRVIRASDNTTATVRVNEAGGVANSATQDAFCTGTDCVVTEIFDQSPFNNHLPIFNYPSRQPGQGPRVNKGVNASADRNLLGGHPVYSAWFEPGMGYRTPPGPANGTAVGEEAESMYMVTSGRHFNDHCCFDYGNAESNAGDDGDGTMEAIYFGNDIGWNREGRQPFLQNLTGPWIGADIENGMYTGDDYIDQNKLPTWRQDFVTAMLKGRPCEFVLKGGNAQTGPLVTLYDGVRPQHGDYNPMRLQGSIILGTGGDDSQGAQGVFFEGAMVTGFVSAELEGAVQANIVAAGYGR